MNPKISRSELVTIMDKLSAKLPARKFTREMASYLLSEKCTSEVDSLSRELISYRAERGLVEATAVSAHPLSAAAINEAKRKVKQVYPSARKITINQRIDPELIGGVRLELPEQQLDLTLRSKINKFKQLTAGN